MRVRVIGSQLYIINQLREKERSKLCETEKFPFFFVFVLFFENWGIYAYFWTAKPFKKARPVVLNKILVIN